MDITVDDDSLPVRADVDEVAVDDGIAPSLAPAVCVCSFWLF